MKIKNYILPLLAFIGVLGFFYWLTGRKNKWLFPVPGGKITSRFGNRKHPITNIISFHNGIDIAAPSGTAILAPFSGKVINTYTHSTGGQSMIIQTDDGYLTGYAHLKNYAVKKGDTVKRGQKIAEVGSTGAVTGPHLHFTVSDLKANKIDPELFFK
jgi:murein DD-endopeptidase MepM/ murein hydrolase activator NlpD